MIDSTQFIAALSATNLRKDVLSVISKKADTITSKVNNETIILVDGYTNTKIADAKNNIIGGKNSFDIVTQNISNIDLSNAIRGSATTDLTDKVAASYYKQIENAIVGETPSNFSFSELVTSSDIAIKSLASRNVEYAVEEKSTSIFSTPSTNQGTGILAILSGILGAGFIADKIDSKYTSTIATKSIKESAEFDINNTDNSKKTASTSSGFVDPTGNFPTSDYSELADTNKLAQGDIRGTPLQDRIRSRMRGAKLPNEGSWDQPESSFKAQYPFNKVTQTESGHIIEIDDTPGAERIHIYHRSGTFLEIDPNGSIVSRTMGSEYKIIDKNGYIAISGKANVSVTGSCNVHVGGDCNLEVVGDAFINSGNDIQVNAAGRLQLSGGEAIDIRSPKIYVQADEEFHLTADTKANLDVKLLNIKVETKTNIESKETINIKASENMNVQIEGDYNTKVKGTIKSQSDTDVNIKSGAKFKVESTGDGSFKFGGNMAMDYATGQFANGQSVSADSAGEAAGSETAEYSKSGLLVSRSPMLEDIITDPQAMTLADQYSLLVENEGEDYSTQRQRLIDLGLATAAELDTSPIAGESDSGSGASKVDLVPADESLKNVTSLPDNFQLSPHFTLGMVSSVAAVTKDKVIPQKGLSYGEIIYNLQYLALNVLEPIYAVYPNMIVTSGFRDASSSTGPSQHPLGMAVDIQFRGMSKKDYFETARKLKECVQFDQFLLEYCSYTNNPWLHISLDSSRTNRNQISTFWNHRKYGEGLMDLA